VSIQDSVLGLPGFARRRIAIAVGLALSATAAQAQNAPAEQPKTLDKISVAAEPVEEAAKVDRVASPKFTQPLLDTPQTITVVSSAVLNQQGATTLSQALRNTPGVTFLLGENGNTATGDSIFMRGFDTQGSIFIDGIRDLGSVTRDTFNTQQVEIAKGPAGPDYGRGAASGYVNMATKVPTSEDFMGGTASYGTASNARLTGDINHRFEGSGTAIRLNVMGQDGEVDGRDFIERKGWAIAPSIAFGLDGDTRSYFYLLHTEQDNVPDGGVTTLGLDGFYNRNFDPNPLPVTPPAAPTAPGVRPLPVDRENFYGYRSDFEDISGTMFTARFEHDFSDNITLRNSTRLGRLEQFYVLTGVNALTVPNANPNSWTLARTRQSKFQENELFTNQTNLTINVATGSVAHAITTGVEFISEEQFAPTYVGLGTLVPVNPYDPVLADAPPAYAPVRNGVFARGETRRSIRHELRRRVSRRHGAQPGAHAAQPEPRRHSVLVQGRRVVQARAEWQRLPVARHLAAASGRRQLHAGRGRHRQQRQSRGPRAHRGLEPRARRQMGIQRGRLHRHRRVVREQQQE
jgi:catecholate siderophore receptor